MRRMIVSDFQTNCYIENNDLKEAFIVDPGGNGKKIWKYLNENELQLKAILLTHGHIDHIGAVEYLYNKTHCLVYAHQETIELVKDASMNLSAVFGEPYVLNVPIIEAEDEFEVIGYKMRWYFMPGHCQGSSMIYMIDKQVMFSGDVLFKGSIGRYDFPTSSHYDTKCSLEKIKAFDFDCHVLPGHGDFTTLNEEKKNNPYLR